MKSLHNILFIGAFFAVSWAMKDLLEYRHSIHLTVNKPDNPRLSLKNLERTANIMLDKRQGKYYTPTFINPYDTPPYCNHNERYRTIDGTCNNLVNGWKGAAKTPLGRMSRVRYQDGYNAPSSKYFHSKGNLPSARKISVSLTMTKSNSSNKNTHLLMNFGQFLDHDFTLSPESGGEGGQESVKKRCCEATKEELNTKLKECLPIYTHNDPVFVRTCIPFLRSAPVPSFPGSPDIRHQLNDLTTYIDASQVYGSANIKALSLREFVGGRLKSTTINMEESLPPSEENPANCKRSSVCQFLAGDIRNSEQAGLTSVHTLFLREHNRIAKELSALNLHWSDEKVYQETRKIVGAILQRLAYNEWLPEIIGTKMMKKYDLSTHNHGRFHGYNPKTNPTIMTEFSTAAFRFGHSMVRQTFSRSETASLKLNSMFNAFKTIHTYGSDSIMEGLVRDPAERSDRLIAEGLRDKLFGKEADLLAFNIQRGRDHGVASYNEIRASLKLPVYDCYKRMPSQSHSLTMTNDFKKVYPSPMDIEAFPGGITEIPMEGAVIGETFAHIIAVQFKKLKYGDRFWHERPYSEIGFKTDQLQEIRKVRFATLFCQNIPDVQVRLNLLQMETSENHAIPCDQVPTMDLTKWKEKP